MPQHSPVSTLERLILGHVEDPASSSFLNTPFIVKVNLYNRAVDAALDTGASLSAIGTNIISGIPGSSEKVHPWLSPPIQLANRATCSPTGVIWLNIDSMENGSTIDLLLSLISLLPLS